MNEISAMEHICNRGWFSTLWISNSLVFDIDATRRNLLFLIIDFELNQMFPNLCLNYFLVIHPKICHQFKN